VPKGVLVVRTSAASPERDDEYNAWLDQVHVPAVRETPGFVGARRYRVRDAGRIRADETTPTYLTIYDVEADDFDAALNALSARSAEGRTGHSDAMRLDPPPSVTFYELIE
jgi:hypothetical protein